MASGVKTLWSPEIKPEILSPRQILSSQANALSSLTKGLLIGELSEIKTEKNKIVFSLDIFAPALNYRHRVLTATHSVPLVYPVLLDADVFRRKGIGEVAVASAVVNALQRKKPESQADTDQELVSL